MSVYELDVTKGQRTARSPEAGPARELADELSALAELGLLRLLGGTGSQARYELTEEGRAALEPDLGPAA